MALDDMANALKILGVGKQSAAQALYDNFTDYDSIEEAIDGITDKGGVLNSLFASLGSGAKDLGTGIKGFLLSPFVKVIGVIVAITAAMKLLDAAILTPKEATEKMSESFNEFENAQKEVENLNSELQKTRDNITDLQSKESLSLVDKGELDNLRETEKSLAMQKDIAEELAAIRAKQAAQNTAVAYNKNFKHEVSQDAVNEAKDWIASQKEYNGGFLGDSIVVEERDISKQIALLQEYKAQRDDAFSSASDWIDWDNKANDITDSLWEQVDALIEQKTNLEESKRAIEANGGALTEYQQNALNDINSSIDYIYKELSPYEWKQMKIDDIFGQESFSKTKKDIIYLARASGDAAISMEDIPKALALAAKDAGIEVQDLVDAINDEIEGSLKSVDAINKNVKSAITDNSELISGISSIREVLNAQTTGTSLSAESFNSDELKDYASALEYVNGALQLNAEKVNSIIKSKAKEQIVINDTNKALAQAKYLENAARIEELRHDLLDSSKYKTQAHVEAIESSIASLEAQNDALLDSCTSYELMSASLREATSAYQHWLNAQSSAQTGDMFDGTLEAINRIDDTLNDRTSEYYGRVGRSDYQAAIDLIIPDHIDSEDQAAVQKYLKDISGYFTYDGQGNRAGLNIEQFCKRAVEEGLMVLNEAGTEYEIAGGKTMEDFAKGLGLALPFVQAMFGEMQEFGAAFDWSDEVEKTIGDLAVSAVEAREILRDIEGNENLEIVLDVNDIEDGQAKIDALNGTIDQMRGIIELSTDPTEISAAEDIIRHCIAQKQLLCQPDIMKVDTTMVDGQLGSAIAKIQEFVAIQNQIELQTELGVDTTAAKESLANVANEISAINPNILAELNVDTTSLETIESSIRTLEIPAIINAGVKEDAIIGHSGESTQKVNVIYTKDSSEVDGYVPSDHNPTVTYRLVSTAVDSYDPKNLDRDVTYHIKTKGFVGSLFGGGHDVNGTAHTSGTACAGGNWGKAVGGKTLVGELGREIVVDPHTGRWYTVGDFGAEFRDIPRGAIVFNHKQSDSLLKNGYVAGRASALVGGTAMVGGGISVNAVSASKYSGGYTPYQSSAKSSNSKNSKDADTDSFDWIEVAIKRIEDAINRLTSAATSAYKSLKSKLGFTVDQIALVNEELELQEKAYTRYMEQANSVGLSSDLAKLVQTGAVDISEYDKETQELIKDYQNWYEKANECSNAIEDLHENLAELYEDNFNNIQEDFDNQLELLEHLTNSYENQLDVLEAKGYMESAEYYEALQDVEREKIEVLNKELAALEKSFSDAMNSGEIEKGSDAW